MRSFHVEKSLKVPKPEQWQYKSKLQYLGLGQCSGKVATER